MTPGSSAFAKDLARKCLTFELAFESSISNRIGVEMESDVKSKVKLTTDPDSFVISGEAPLKNTRFDVTPIGDSGGCVLKTQRGGSTFTVSDLRWTVAYGTGGRSSRHAGRSRGACQGLRAHVQARAHDGERDDQVPQARRRSTS